MRPTVTGMADHCQLTELTGDTLLANTRRRFDKDLIYTTVGSILIAVNPFADVSGLYGDEAMAQCKGHRLGLAPQGPHIYSIAESAFASLRLGKGSASMPSAKRQVIVVSGESGAGKTEANKQLMSFLCWRGGSTDASSGLTHQILEANPVLEAFGNAKTVRNANSSRFGRYVLLLFDAARGTVRGAKTQVYLLETSRVTATSGADERSFHIFYQMLAGGRRIEGGTQTAPSLFRYLSRGAGIIRGVDDAADFGAVERALGRIGLGADEMSTLWELLLALLHLGNLTFLLGGSEGHAAISDAGADTLQIASTALGCASIRTLLETRRITVRGETTVIHHTPDKASSARDALVKAVYSRTFIWLVSRINHSTAAPSGSTTSGTTSDSSAGGVAAEGGPSVGLLDIFGFENFKHNSFEQLCINYANEVLQQLFLSCVFAAESLLYEREGIRHPPLHFDDNAHVLRILDAVDADAAPAGVFPLLESYCRQPQSTDADFCAALHRTHASSAVLSAPKRTAKGPSADEAFIVSHFAGDVIYTVAGMLAKNDDSLAPEWDAALRASTSTLVSSIASAADGAAGARKPPAAGGGAGASSSFGTVGGKFLKSLSALMVDLRAADAHFVRCIKPNVLLQPRTLDGPFVLEQLRRSGVLDAVRALKQGYPTRLPFEKLHSHYRSVVPPSAIPTTCTPRDFTEQLCEICAIDRGRYTLGETLALFKLGAARVVEDLLDAPPAILSQRLKELLDRHRERMRVLPTIEGWLRTWTARRRFLRRVADARRKAAEARRVAERAERRDAGRTKLVQIEARRRADAVLKAYTAQQQGVTQANNGAAQTATLPSDAAAEADTPVVPLSMVRAAAGRRLGALLKQLDKADEDPSQASLRAVYDAAGGCAGCVQLASLHVDQAGVQAAFAACIDALLASGPAYGGDATAAGAFAALADAAKRHRKSLDVNEATGSALRRLEGHFTGPTDTTPPKNKPTSDGQTIASDAQDADGERKARRKKRRDVAVVGGTSPSADGVTSGTGSRERRVRTQAGETGSSSSAPRRRKQKRRPHGEARSLSGSRSLSGTSDAAAKVLATALAADCTVVAIEKQPSVRQKQKNGHEHHKAPNGQRRKRRPRPSNEAMVI